jgi:hypothetical protein
MLWYNTLKHTAWTRIPHEEALSVFRAMLPETDADGWFAAGKILASLMVGETSADWAFAAALKADPSLARQVESVQAALVSRAEEDDPTSPPAPASEFFVDPRISQFVTAMHLDPHGVLWVPRRKGCGGTIPGGSGILVGASLRARIPAVRPSPMVRVWSKRRCGSATA